MSRTRMQPKATPTPHPPEEPAGDEGQPITRREFVAGGLASITLSGISPMIVPSRVLGGEAAPSNTLAIAAVGCGGMGRNYLEGCKAERIVALCDIDHDFVAKRGVWDKFPGANRYRDWREMFDKEAKNFDALIVATPDHTHAVILMAALQLGKHIYCAKPVTHTIAEARKVKEAVLRNPKLVTKASVQASGTDAAVSTTELLNSGAIGPVRELNIWCDHPAYPCSLVRPTDTQTPPAGMDWDLWIGPAPFRPFHSAYHPENWRPWWDFGSGTVGDMGCHTFHMYFRELQLAAPKAVYGCVSTRNDGFFRFVSTPECQSNANMVTWEFPARGSLPPLTMHWYDGGMKPHRPPELDRRTELPASGVLFVGEKGVLIAGYYGGNPFGRGAGPDGRGNIRGLPGGLLLPEDRFKDLQPPPRTMRRVEDHYGEWTQACKAGAKTICPIEFGCEMTELALLGSLALRARRLLEWDSAAMRITNSSQANNLIDPPYRSGW